jgi:hypothetical protein
VGTIAAGKGDDARIGRRAPRGAVQSYRRMLTRSVVGGSIVGETPMNEASPTSW